jgi:hypothetical protein
MKHIVSALQRHCNTIIKFRPKKSQANVNKTRLPPYPYFSESLKICFLTVNIIPRILHICFFFTLIYPVKYDNEVYFTFHSNLLFILFFFRDERVRHLAALFVVSCRKFGLSPPPRACEGGGGVGGLVCVWKGQLGSGYTGVLETKLRSSVLSCERFCGSDLRRKLSVSHIF